MGGHTFRSLYPSSFGPIRWCVCPAHKEDSKRDEIASSQSRTAASQRCPHGGFPTHLRPIGGDERRGIETSGFPGGRTVSATQTARSSTFGPLQLASTSPGHLPLSLSWPTAAVVRIGQPRLPLVPARLLACTRTR